MISDYRTHSDSGSLSDESAPPGQPSTAFLMTSAHDPDPDDSFASTSSNRSSDSLGVEEYAAEEVAGAPVHPFARATAGEEHEFDDSFDSMDGDDGGRCEGEIEETVVHCLGFRLGSGNGRKRRVGS